MRSRRRPFNINIKIRYRVFLEHMAMCLKLRVGEKVNHLALGHTTKTHLWGGHHKLVISWRCKATEANKESKTITLARKAPLLLYPSHSLEPPFPKESSRIEEQAKEIKRSSRCERNIESMGEVLAPRGGTPATCGVSATPSDVV